MREAGLIPELHFSAPFHRAGEGSLHRRWEERVAWCLRDCLRIGAELYDPGYNATLTFVSKHHRIRISQCAGRKGPRWELPKKPFCGFFKGDN